MNATVISFATVAATVGDPGRTRIVLASIIGLVVIGVILAGAAVWLYRSTRHDLPLLAPLEVMGARSWRKLDGSSRRRRLDEVRPPEAQTLAVVAESSAHEVGADEVDADEVDAHETEAVHEPDEAEAVGEANAVGPDDDDRDPESEHAAEASAGSQVEFESEPR